MGLRRGPCGGSRAASYKGQSRREKEGIQEHKKPAIHRKDKISSLVERTAKTELGSFYPKNGIESWSNG